VTSILSAITGWLLFAALVTALGSLAARWLLIPRLSLGPDESGEDTSAFLTRAAGRMGLLGASFLPVAMALVFYRQLVEFRDPFVPWTEDATLLLTGTAWGRTWMEAAAASIAAIGAFGLVRVGIRGAWFAATVIVVALAGFPALTGHASGTEELRALTLAADTLHVLAAGSWVGGLGFVLYSERSWRVWSGGESLLPSLVPVFSPVAIGSVAALVITGTLAGWIHLEGVVVLATTSYGRIFVLKLSLVLAVMVLGAVSWKQLTPRLGDLEGQDALRRAASRELLIAQLVLLVTAILVRSSPMGH